MSTIRVRSASLPEPLTPAASPQTNPERAYAQCQAYHILKRHIERYACGEITGQSFLLAGHRGGGKTTLAHLAVQEVRRLAEGQLAQLLSINVSLAKRYDPRCIGTLTLTTSSNLPSLAMPQTPTSESPSQTARQPTLLLVVSYPDPLKPGSTKTCKEQFCPVVWTEKRATGEQEFLYEIALKEFISVVAWPQLDEDLDLAHPGVRDFPATASIRVTADKLTVHLTIPATTAQHWKNNDLVLSGTATFAAKDATRVFRAIPFLVPLHGPDLLPEPNPSPLRLGPESSQLNQLTLRQITRSFHRSLCEEIGRLFDRQAAAAEEFELSASLKTELHHAPDLSTLRRYWARFGLLQRGLLARERSSGRLLFPAILTRDLKKPLEAQGSNEILAVHTAIEAARACNAAETAAGSSSATFPFLDSAGLPQAPLAMDRAVSLASPILSLLTGAFAANAVVDVLGPITAGAIGLATVLLTYSFLRRTGPPPADQTLLPDTSVSSLDMLLPVMVDRCFTAGLAPVFVVDELDKVEKLEVRMSDLMKQLKYFVTDRALFCFAADREYYERFEARLKETFHPTEETYFADRLLITFTFNELYRHLDISPPAGGSSDGESLFKYLIVFQSGGHIGELKRTISTHTQRDGTLRVEGHGIERILGYRLAILIQIAIESVLSRRHVTERLRQVPFFSQWLLDALYLIPHYWKRDDQKVEFNLTQFDDDLRQHALGASVSRPSKPAESPPILDSRDKAFLHGAVDLLLGYLSAPHSLLVDIHQLPSPQLREFDPAGLDLIATSCPLLENLKDVDIPGQPKDKRITGDWVFDQYGRPFPGEHCPSARDTRDAVENLLTGEQNYLRQLYADLLVFEGTVLGLGISFADACTSLALAWNEAATPASILARPGGSSAPGSIAAKLLPLARLRSTLDDRDTRRRVSYILIAVAFRGPTPGRALDCLTAFSSTDPKSLTLDWLITLCGPRLTEVHKVLLTKEPVAFATVGEIIATLGAP